jgi:hypothetical protein
VDGVFELGSFTCSSSVDGHTKTIVVRRFGEKREDEKKQGSAGEKKVKKNRRKEGGEGGKVWRK